MIVNTNSTQEQGTERGKSKNTNAAENKESI